MTLLVSVVDASRRVDETSLRSRKVAILADLLRGLEPDEVAPVTGVLSGLPRQGRVGVGHSTVFRLEQAPVGRPSLLVGDLDASIDAIRAARWSGSGAKRKQILCHLFGRATESDAEFIRRLFTGELRQ